MNKKYELPYIIFWGITLMLGALFSSITECTVWFYSSVCLTLLVGVILGFVSLIKTNND